MQSLKRLEPAPNEIVIVLDGLPSSALDIYIPGLPDYFRVLENPEKLGPAAARNLGVAHSKGELLIFIDSDVATPMDLVRVVQIEFEKNPNLSALFGSYDSSPGHLNFFSQFKNLMHHYVHQQALEKATTFWGACGAIKREAFEQIGGFNESMAWLEDVDLGMRLSQRGGEIKLLKSLQVKHWKRWTMASLLVSDVFHRAFPWTRLIATHGIFQNDLNTDYRSRISAMLVFLGLGTLLLRQSIPNSLFLAGVMGAIFLGLNMSFYSFLAKKKGALFLLPAIFWHCCYYVYSSIAFLVGIILAFLPKRIP